MNAPEWMGDQPLTEEEEEAFRVLEKRLTGNDEKIRTMRQNAALYRWERQIAKLLNDSGSSFNDHRLLVLDIPWTQDLIHKFIILAFSDAMYDKKSSADLTTEELSKVHQAAEQVISERTGIYEPFTLRG